MDKALKDWLENKLPQQMEDSVYAPSVASAAYRAAWKACSKHTLERMANKLQSAGFIAAALQIRQLKP